MWKVVLIIVLASSCFFDKSKALRPDLPCESFFRNKYLFKELACGTKEVKFDFKVGCKLYDEKLELNYSLVEAPFLFEDFILKMSFKNDSLIFFNDFFYSPIAVFKNDLSSKKKAVLSSSYPKLPITAFKFKNYQVIVKDVYYSNKYNDTLFLFSYRNTFNYQNQEYALKECLIGKREGFLWFALEDNKGVVWESRSTKVCCE